MTVVNKAKKLIFNVIFRNVGLKKTVARMKARSGDLQSKLEGCHICTKHVLWYFVKCLCRRRPTKFVFKLFL